MATKKNKTKGYNAVDKLVLRALETETTITSGASGETFTNGDTYINATGQQDNVNITLTPQGEGTVNIGGVLFSSDSSIAADRIEVDEIIANTSYSYNTTIQTGITGALFELNIGETGLGVTPEEIAGIKVDRGLLDVLTLLSCLFSLQ